MHLSFRTRRVQFVLIVGEQAEEEDEFVVVSNDGGDFEPAPVDDLYDEEEDVIEFGFRGGRRG